MARDMEPSGKQGTVLTGRDGGAVRDGFIAGDLEDDTGVVYMWGLERGQYSNQRTCVSDLSTRRY